MGTKEKAKFSNSTSTAIFGVYALTAFLGGVALVFYGLSQSL